MASGVPAGLGEPVYGKLDAELAAALMGINAAKGVEIGDGFAAASTDGSEAADELAPAEGDGEGEGITALSNRAGGILGGISTGEPIVARVAFKPTSSLPRARRTVNRAGEAVETEVRGRHDPCVAIRAVPVVEAMMVLTLADHLLRHRGQTGRPGPVQWG
jgi:chorismate synthase